MAIQDILPAGWHVQNSTGSYTAPAQSYSDEEDEGAGKGTEAVRAERIVVERALR